MNKNSAKIYRIPCLDGSGIMKCYDVFPGIDFFVNDFRAFHCEENREKSDALKINFCVSGRFECSFGGSDHCILGPGDMSVNICDGYHGGVTVSEFPLGYYQGLGIHVDCDKAGKWAGKNLGILALDFQKIKKTLMGDRWYWVRAASPRCEHVFRELYEGAAELEADFIRLKLIELFMLLQKMPLVAESAAYFPKSQIELVKHIRDHLVNDDAAYTSLEQLSAEHGISVTQLQKIFKTIYGVPLYQYLREYRLEKAAVLLVDTERRVAEIANDCSYSNPGKFAEAFRRRYGMTPTEYRRKEKLKTKME